MGHTLFLYLSLNVFHNVFLNVSEPPPVSPAQPAPQGPGPRDGKGPGSRGPRGGEGSWPQRWGGRRGREGPGPEVGRAQWWGGPWPTRMAVQAPLLLLGPNSIWVVTWGRKGTQRASSPQGAPRGAQATRKKLKAVPRGLLGTLRGPQRVPGAKVLFQRLLVTLWAIFLKFRFLAWLWFGPSGDVFFCFIHRLSLGSFSMPIVAAEGDTFCLPLPAVMPADGNWLFLVTLPLALAAEVGGDVPLLPP